MRYPIIIIPVLIVGLYSCQKKDNTVSNPAGVAISITSPANGQLYRSGDTISIIADVSYASELHGYEVKIIDTTSGTILYDDVQHVHDDHFSIHDKWVNTTAQQAGLKLSLVAAIDHDGNNAEKDIIFRYQP